MTEVMYLSFFFECEVMHLSFSMSVYRLCVCLACRLCVSMYLNVSQCVCLSSMCLYVSLCVCLSSMCLGLSSMYLNVSQSVSVDVSFYWYVKDPMIQMTQVIE
jgi:hypothetical protein